jgi:F-type H+-transporting ATPase subunit b
METLIAPAFNFIALVAILAYYLRAPMRGFVRTRHDTLREELERVGGQLKTARTRYDEFLAKIASMNSEIASLREQARQDAEAMKKRVLADGQRMSQLIVADARTAAEAMFTDFRAQLRTEMGEKVLDRAEAILRARLTGDDRVRIAREFSRQVEQIQ